MKSINKFINEGLNKWNDDDDYNLTLTLSSINNNHELSPKTKNRLNSWMNSIKDRLS